MTDECPKCDKNLYDHIWDKHGSEIKDGAIIETTCPGCQVKLSINVEVSYDFYSNELGDEDSDESTQAASPARKK